MSEVELVSASMSQKGICRECGASRETGNHRKCDLSAFRRSQIRYTANNETTTAKHLQELAATLPADAPIRFRLEFTILPRLAGDPPKGEK